MCDRIWLLSQKCSLELGDVVSSSTTAVSLLIAIDRNTDRDDHVSALREKEGDHPSQFSLTDASIRSLRAADSPVVTPPPPPSLSPPTYQSCGRTDNSSESEVTSLTSEHGRPGRRARGLRHGRTWPRAVQQRRPRGLEEGGREEQWRGPASPVQETGPKHEHSAADQPQPVPSARDPQRRRRRPEAAESLLPAGEAGQLQGEAQDQAPVHR